VNPHYLSVAQRANHRCEYCHAPEAIFNFAFEVEHILPSTQQGPDDISNLALACRACNVYKSDRLTVLDSVTQTQVALFHPRADRWDDHFFVDEELGLVQGKRPTARATIQCLRINDPPQVEARRQWMRLGLYP
jgi:hypothetical protein